MRTFIIGDIHGGYKSLMQCLERSKFDYKKDRLIHLGDVCDGLSQTKEAIDELLKIKYIVNILGNHDAWFLGWIHDDMQMPYEWVTQGGQATLLSYNFKAPQKEHIDFLEASVSYFIENNKLFVHGGIVLDVVGNHTVPIEKQEVFWLMWDRGLIKDAVKHQYDFDHGFLKNDYRNEVINFPKMTTYDEVFVGHTTTESWDTTLPVHACEVWDLDTGGGYGIGKLTIMDLETKEFFQSDPVNTLYPVYRGS